MDFISQRQLQRERNQKKHLCIIIIIILSLWRFFHLVKTLNCIISSKS